MDSSAKPTEASDEKREKVKLLLLSKPASQKRLDAIDRNLLEKLCFLDNGRLQISAVECTLPIFPAEIWGLILLHADIQALITFRRVSSTARASVDRLHQYRNIVDHYPALLKAALATGVAPWVTLPQLHQAFTSDRCFRCDQAAEYIYLLNCSRVCRVCLQRSRSVRPISLSTCLEFSFWPQLGFKVPRLLTIPGRYGKREILISGRLVLLNRLTIRKIAKSYGSEEDRWKDRGREIEHLPYACSIRAPWLDRKSNTTDWGYLCKSCFDNPFKGEPRIHSRTDLLEHVESCEGAQAMWISFSPSSRR